MSETEYKVIKFVQELLDDERKSGVDITLEMIEQNISRVILMNPRWGRDLDHAAVTEELIRRFSTWIGESAVLHSDEGHHVWLDAPRKKTGATGNATENFWSAHGTTILLKSSTKARTTSSEDLRTLFGTGSGTDAGLSSVMSSPEKQQTTPV